MTDREQNIIALAEFVGREHCPNNDGDIGWYVDADPRTGEPVQVQCEWCETHPNAIYGFNPYESADDCEAVVRKLNEQQIFVEVTFFSNGERWVQIEGRNHTHRDRYEGDDWKHGVCELALKVKEAVAE